jgi:mono/diheme cytochrome c family protein
MSEIVFRARRARRLDLKERMNHRGRFRAGFMILAGAIAIGTALLLAGASPARADDAAAGRRIWTAKAGCPDCHGWAGDGFSSAFHAEGAAPSLRKTQLTRDQIRETIQCGRPGTPMPHFDRFAYTDKRCYGLTAEDLGDRVPNRAPNTLQPYEIDALADYVATAIKGVGPVTKAECVDYFGTGLARCDSYPDIASGSTR